jgi:hypothetical protein
VRFNGAIQRRDSTVRFNGAIQRRRFLRSEVTASASVAQASAFVSASRAPATSQPQPPFSPVVPVPPPSPPPLEDDEDDELLDEDDELLPPAPPSLGEAHAPAKQLPALHGVPSGLGG